MNREARPHRGIIALLAVGFCLLACSTLTGNPTPVPVVGPPQPDARTYGPGSFKLADPAVGLGDLPSYTATVKITFDGTRHGQPEQWADTYEIAVSQTPIVRILSITQTGHEASELYLAPWSAEAKGVWYERASDGQCIASATVTEPSQIMEPASMLPLVIGADQAGDETVHGVPANHYTFDERALGEAGRASATGELWVASDGGYVVKYVLTLKGAADFFGEGGSGTITWAYDLGEANQAVTTALPPECPPGLVDAPVLPDAENVEKIPSVTLYNTPSDLASAVAFYQKELPAIGWKPVEPPSIGDTVAALNFTQGTQQLSVIITTEAGSPTRVRLVLTNVTSH